MQRDACASVHTLYLHGTARGWPVGSGGRLFSPWRKRKTVKQRQSPWPDSMHPIHHRMKALCWLLEGHKSAHLIVMRLLSSLDWLSSCTTRRAAAALSIASTRFSCEYADARQALLLGDVAD